MIPQCLSYHLADDVLAFSTTRKGGVSRGNYGEFNINYYCGDERSAIEANRKALCDWLNIDTNRLVYPHQVHQAEVRMIADEFLSLSSETRKMLLEGVDAVMTDVPNVCIGVSTADCMPILLYDTEHRAICAVHAGWRGTVARIVQKAVSEMRAAYHTKPEMLRAVIGPGISMKNFEVGDEVYEQFVEAGFEMEKMAFRMPLAHTADIVGQTEPPLRWHIDLWECNRQQLTEAGLPVDHVQIAGICTYDRFQEFFSARRLGIDSGRIFTGAMLQR